jgi:hypothetical protein
MQDIIRTLEAAKLRKPQLDKLRRFLGHLVREREFELRNITSRKQEREGPPTERDLERKLGLRVTDIGYRRLQGTPGINRIRNRLRRIA